MKRKGIMICGLNGAGKSTLGKEIACRWNAEWIDNEQLYFSNEGEYGTFCSSQTAWHRLYARLDDRAQANTPFIYCCVNNEDDDLLSYLDGIVYLSIGRRTRRPAFANAPNGSLAPGLPKTRRCRKEKRRFLKACGARTRAKSNDGSKIWNGKASRYCGWTRWRPSKPTRTKSNGGSR